MSGLGVRDPREQAHFCLTYKVPQPHLSATRSFEATQSRTVGSLGSPTEKQQAKTKGDPVSTYFSRQATEFETKVVPAFLDSDGKYIQEGLPDRIIQCQGQPLTSTGVLDGSRGMCQAPRAISAIHSFNDMAPALTTEYARDSDTADEVSWTSTINKRGAKGVFTPSGAPPLTRLQELSQTLSGKTSGHSNPSSIGDPVVRKESVDAFFHRTGGGSHLKMQDLGRLADERPALPGHGNAKLIGGKWRYVSRASEGEPLFTDYYGRCDDTHCDYYGRIYRYLPQ